ncbi:MAG: hypothetical protein QOI01_3867 [Mycobacterium sp.]|jgi:hypothetical protein|nr:hypothetical protein [Mycobacterium sp.]
MAVTPRNLDGYGTPSIEWDRVEQTMGNNVPQAPGTGGPGRHTAWLTTLDATGQPHVRPLGIALYSGSWYFNSSPDTRKTRNIADDARCVVSLATEPFDLVVEGTANRVTDADELAGVAAVWVEQGWPASVDGDALTADFSAPSGGKPPYYVYRVDPSTVYAFGTSEPYGATRFDL